MDTPQETPSKDEGLRLLKAGQLDEAIAALEAVVKTAPDDAQVHTYLGVAYNQKNDRMRAINHFEQSLHIEESARSYYNLGQVYESVNRVDEAVRQYRMAAEMDPGYTPAQDALDRLRTQYAAANPQAQAAPEPTMAVAVGPGAPQPTQAMPAASGIPGVYAGAPAAYGPAGGPAASAYGGPPDLLDIKRKKEQEVIEQHKRMMKSGLIYGIVCGAILLPAVYFGMGRFLAFPMPGFAFSGFGLFVWLGILIAIGAGVGAAIGCWVGHTCGGESAGLQAGGLLGLVAGLILALVGGASGMGFVLFLVTFGGFGLVNGYLIGMMVDRSIGWD